MKLIIIDGGPASGKNTLGELLVNKFQKNGGNAVLLDLDAFVERYNPKWIWNDENQKEIDQLNARIDFSKEVNKYLKKGDTVIAIGERFLYKKDIVNFMSKIKIRCPVFLFHLSPPFTLREKRLHARGPHSLIDLEKDQKDRDAVKDWLGYVYENINSPAIDSENIMLLIQDKKGLINIDKLKRILMKLS